MAIPINSMFYVNNWLKGFLFFIILILPFQNLPRTFIKETNEPILSLIRYIDEGGFLISLVILLSFMLLRPDFYRIKQLPFTKYIVVFFLIALISLSLNQVPLLQGFFGIYDVTKNILVLYVFSHLRFTREDILKIISMLQKIAIVIGFVAIFAEISVMVWGIEYFVRGEDEKRFFLYRVYSLTGTGSWNYLGIYMSLIFFLSLVTTNPSWKRGVIFLMILSTIFLTFSRQAWVGFGLMACLLKKKLIPAGVLALLVLIWMLLSNFQEFNSALSFRGFAFIESLKILRDSPFFGAGPGMFGGLAASIFGTPYYDGWPDFFREFAIHIHGCDMFWPWIWGEFGIIGLLTYLSVWASIFFYLKKIGGFFLTKGDRLMYDLANVLRYFIMVLAVMGCGGGLNAAFVVFTYFALVGMYISVYQTERI